ncbi:MAG: GEVED domain-containing protein [Sedimentisphaerales bacterium]|nr:GEVED domain-containing protein [Sedimentisphaerales bacterium]
MKDYKIKLSLVCVLVIILNTINIVEAQPMSPPANNSCQNAMRIGEVINQTYNTSYATFDGPGHCTSSPNIWYRYTASRACNVTVSLCGSSYDTALAIYRGSECYPRQSNMIGCNDDACGRQSEITFPATAGTEYLIEVGGFGVSKGAGVISISCDSEPPVSLNNDNCQNAKPIGNVSGMAFDTSNATFDGPGHCLTSPNIWYIYTATCTGKATVSLCGSGYDTKMAVYNGGGCNPSLSRLIECNDDSCGWQSEVTFDATAGQQYLIEVGGFGDNKGQGLISVSCEGSTPPTSQSDLGDAPDSTNNFGQNMTAYPKGGPSGVRAHYPTVYNDGRTTGPFGPIHLNSERVVAHLGKNITRENEADTGPDQDITNNIRPTANTPDNDNSDDGIVFPVNMPKCRWTTLDYIVNVINPGTNLYVNIWCDWNRDGDWDDSTLTNPSLACSKGIVSEWAVKNQYLINLPAGLNQITSKAFLSWHPDAGTKQIWMRITLSPKPWTSGSAPGVRGNGGSGPRDGHEFGETEDYYFIPETSFSICEDYNGDGVINLQDLAAFTTDWLENCP